MAGAFTITVATNNVVLDDDLRGETAFIVFNATGRQLRARASVVPLTVEGRSAESTWLQIVGERERSFGISGTHQYTVKIKVPPGTTEGAYHFRLDVVAEDRPDEDSAQGPTVRFEVPETPEPPPPPPPPKAKGYVESLLGSVAGGLAIGLLGAGIGVLIAVIATDDPLGRVIAMLLLGTIGALIGYWVGSSVGCWLALRYREHYFPGRTAAVYAAALPVWTVIMVFALGWSLDAIGGFMLVVIAIFAAVPPPLGARALWVRLTTGEF